jgi:hypothetical protein
VGRPKKEISTEAIQEESSVSAVKSKAPKGKSSGKQEAVFLKVRCTFLEEALGTWSPNPDIHRAHIADKAPDATTVEEEVASLGVDKVLETQMTVFPRVDGIPVVRMYQVKGAFKEACKHLARMSSTVASGTSAHQKKIIGCVFFTEKYFFIHGPEGEGTSPLGNPLSRPLRIEDAKGTRSALATSETVKEGSFFDMTINIADAQYEPLVREALGFWKYAGFLQWRNSGKGAISVKVLGREIAPFDLSIEE